MPMGELLTHDLAVALKTPLGDAEDLKVQCGYAHTRFAPPAETVQVKKLADRPAETISLQQLTAFIQPRIEEIAEILGERLRQSGRFEEASTGIVLCGGTAALPGIAQVFESMLQCPCRVLKQAHQDGLDGLLQDPANAVLAVFWRMDATKKSGLDRIGLVRRETCSIGFGSGSSEIFN